MRCFVNFTTRDVEALFCTVECHLKAIAELKAVGEWHPEEEWEV